MYNLRAYQRGRINALDAQLLQAKVRLGDNKFIQTESARKLLQDSIIEMEHRLAQMEDSFRAVFC